MWRYYIRLGNITYGSPACRWRLDRDFVKYLGYALDARGDLGGPLSLLFRIDESCELGVPIINTDVHVRKLEHWIVA